MEKLCRSLALWTTVVPGRYSNLYIVGGVIDRRYKASTPKGLRYGSLASYYSSIRGRGGARSGRWRGGRIVKHPFAKLREEIGTVRKEGKEAHETIGGNINSLGEKLERLISESSDRLERKVDHVGEGLSEVQKGVSSIDGAMPHIVARIGNLERG